MQGEENIQPIARCAIDKDTCAWICISSRKNADSWTHGISANKLWYVKILRSSRLFLSRFFASSPPPPFVRFIPSALIIPRFFRREDGRDVFVDGYSRSSIVLPLVFWTCRHHHGGISSCPAGSKDLFKRESAATRISRVFSFSLSAYLAFVPRYVYVYLSISHALVEACFLNEESLSCTRAALNSSPSRIKLNYVSIVLRKLIIICAFLPVTSIKL